MSNRSDFAIFILTHGRANNVITDKTLERVGYTGKVYYLIDNEDDQADEYRRIYGESSVIQFDKKHYASKVDAVDNFEDRRCILYARHAVFDAAKSVGLTYFQMLDDDVSHICYRRKDGDSMRSVLMRNYDDVVNVLIDLLEDTGAVTVAMAQGGDFIGGVGSFAGKNKYSRKCMNSFVCKVGQPIDFKGTMNEDVSAYTLYGMRGQLMLTVNSLCISMPETQSISGGMTEFYKSTGTYVKSMYSIITSPACVKVSVLQDKHGTIDNNARIHHNVVWDNAYVKIIRG